MNTLSEKSNSENSYSSVKGMINKKYLGNNLHEIFLSCKEHKDEMQNQ